MKFLRIVWKDLKMGNHINIYITELGALVIFILSALGILKEPTAIYYATLAVLVIVLYNTLKILRGTQPQILISKDNDVNVNHLCEYVAANKIVKAQMIQYSGDMVRGLIEKLLNRGAKVELLLQHPDNMINQFQKTKMNTVLATVKNDFKDFHNLSIRYYKEPASIKAVKFDDKLLSMGWYTYRNKKSDDKEPWLYGHNNAAISVHMEHGEGRDLVATFNEVFKILWDNAIPEENL